MPWIDLSHPLDNRIPTFPGSPPAEIETIAVIERNGYAEKRLTLNSHSATHLDAPAHILSEGASLDRLPLSAFSGKGLVVDARRWQREIPLEALPATPALREVEFVLFYSGWSRFWGSAQYFNRFPYPAEELSRILAGLSLKGVGFDTPSADASDSVDLLNHRLFLKSDMIILENLTNLDALLGRPFRLYCFPLNIKQGDGSPVRAVAEVDNP